MIKELSELGKTIRAGKAEGTWIHNALKEETISLVLRIKPDGSFVSLQSIEKKKTMAEAVQRTSGKAARLLIDNCGYVLRVYDDESNAFKNKAIEKGEQKAHEIFKKNVAEKFHLFLNRLDDVADLDEVKPILKFYKDNNENGINKVVQAYFLKNISKKDRGGNIAVLVSGDGKYAHEYDSVYGKIIDLHEEKERKLISTIKRKCSICGNNSYPIPEIHEKIKGVPPFDDGKSAARSLVSYNDNAYESYELQRNNNSAICTNCAKTYVEGLNSLLSSGNEVVVKSKKGKEKKVFRYNNRKNFGKDTTMVFWTRKNNKLPEIDELEAPDPDDVAILIKSVTSGTEKDSGYLELDQFYSCTLSGSAARIVVRDWIETSLFDFRKAIAKWFQDIAIDEYNGALKETKTHYARLYDLARSCQRTNEDGKADKQDASLARVAVFLWNGALKNATPPLWILTKVLQRARLDKYGVTADRAALIKLILNRHNKGGEFMISEKIEEGSRPTAYVCGQVFAKLESIQYAALKDLNAGIRERYFTYAMTSPASAFGRIFNLNSKHFTKLKSDKPGLAVTLDKELQELCKDIDINNFPATFSLEQQGQFAIGYYHQRQKQFKSSTKNKTEEE